MRSVLVYGIIALWASTMLTLLAVLSMVWPPDSPWAPWWRTSRRAARIQCRLAGVGSSDVVYDLGCGDGTLLIVAAKEYGARGVGWEIDPVRVFVTRARIWLSGLAGTVRVQREDLFRANLSDATVVAIYLVPRTLDALVPRLLRQTRPGTRVVTSGYECGLPEVRRCDRARIHVYRIPPITGD